MESESAFTQKIQVFQLKRMNFGFVRLAYITKDGIEHVKITYFIILQQGTSGLCVHPFGKMDFHHKIHTSRAKAQNGKLSVRDKQLFMN